MIPSSSLDPPDLLAQLDAHLGVERRQRLVEQQHPRPDREGPRERDALLHAARELVRVAAAGMAEADEVEQLAHPVAAVALPLTAHPQPELDVLPGGHVREQAVGLEDHADVPPVRRRPRQVDAVDDDRAGGRLVEPCDEPQRRRLAAAGRAEQRDELALLELEVDAVERGHGAEDAAQAPQLEEAHRRPPGSGEIRPERPRPTTSSASIAAQVIAKLSSDTAAAGYACVSSMYSM